MLIYHNDLFNYALKRRLVKFCYWITLFFKKVYQHFYLVNCFVLVIGTGKLFQFGLQLIDFCCKLRSLLNLFYLVQKPFGFQSCKDVCLFTKLGGLLVNVHYLSFTAEFSEFQIMQRCLKRYKDLFVIVPKFIA